MLIRQINQATDGGENRHAFFLWIIEEKMEILAKKKCSCLWSFNAAVEWYIY